MNKVSIFAFMLLVLAGLFFSQTVSASVSIKHQLAAKKVGQNYPEAILRRSENVGSTQRSTIPFWNLAKSALQSRLRTWVLWLPFGKISKPDTGCFKIYKSNGDVIHASNFILLDTCIKYKLCNGIDGSSLVVLLSEVSYVTDDDGTLVYGGHSEYFSIIAFLSLCLGIGSIFFLGLLGAAIGLVLATVFGFWSISRLLRREKKYTIRRMAWVLAIFSTLVSLALLVLFTIVIFSF